jgi:deoxyhypusine synthase
MSKNIMKYKPLSFRKIKRYSLRGRKSKVRVSRSGRIFAKGGTFSSFLETVPQILAGKDIRKVADAIIHARKNDRPVILAMGAHPIKVGLSSIIVDLINTDVITAVAANGAAIVHDFELAYMGKTSEDVAAALNNGTFGMAEETGKYINRAINKGSRKGHGIGRSIGEFISSKREIKYGKLSIFGAAFDKGIPATVHVAIGTDIIHMHPEASGSAIGEGTMKDFKLLTSVVSDLEGGVFINLGSAVIIPEVFLKALAIAKNLGNTVNNITTVTMDFLKQYRAMENVLKRPTMRGGQSFFLTGHHEINLPLLAALIKEETIL